ncbi:MAG: glutathione S-transferase family protein [Myxococcales bacterium]|nr:glutathione S-transferase family protein [Myxococcales bacterium]
MKLHRFRYSPYARKAQMMLELARVPHEVVEVPYTDREALAKLTGGYIYVPVLELDDGRAIVESREICRYILGLSGAEAFVPSRLAGPVWAYHDHIDGAIEDVLFRIASPFVRDRWETAFARALYVLIKERKFGAGCVDEWHANLDALIAKAQRLLAPTLETLSHEPFLFGATVTMADLALYGQCAMLEEAEPTLVTRIAPELRSFMRRVEARRS